MNIEISDQVIAVLVMLIWPVSGFIAHLLIWKKVGGARGHVINWASVGWESELLGYYAFRSKEVSDDLFKCGSRAIDRAEKEPISMCRALFIWCGLGIAYSMFGFFSFFVYRNL